MYTTVYAYTPLLGTRTLTLGNTFLVDSFMANVFELFGEKDGKRRIMEAKRKVSWKLAQKEKTIKKKLEILKRENWFKWME